jgi:hypothetical protein
MVLKFCVYGPNIRLILAITLEILYFQRRLIYSNNATKSSSTPTQTTSFYKVYVVLLINTTKEWCQSFMALDQI